MFLVARRVQKQVIIKANETVWKFSAIELLFFLAWDGYISLIKCRLSLLAKASKPGGLMFWLSTYYIVPQPIQIGWENLLKKSRIRETPTLSACANSSTDTMKSHLFETFLHFWALFRPLFSFFGTFLYFSGTFCKMMCHMSQVTCHRSNSTCHKHQEPQAFPRWLPHYPQ